jgi:hypothetical protein
VEQLKSGDPLGTLEAKTSLFRQTSYSKNDPEKHQNTLEDLSDRGTLFQGAECRVETDDIGFQLFR